MLEKSPPNHDMLNVGFRLLIITFGIPDLKFSRFLRLYPLTKKVSQGISHKSSRACGISLYFKRYQVDKVQQKGGNSTSLKMELPWNSKGVSGFIAKTPCCGPRCGVDENRQ